MPWARSLTAPSARAIPSFAAGGLTDPALTSALKNLELTVRRSLDGMLHGDYLGLIPGPGSEPGESRLYQPGDDVRRMDWSATARTTQPHVRQMIADRELETWLVVDMSGSLDFGSSGSTKRDLAVAACAAIAYLTLGGGNRLGAIVTTGDAVVRLPARAGRVHTRKILTTIATTRRSADGVRGDLSAGLEALRRPLRHRGLAVVVSDFLGPIDWDRSLRAHSGRHELLGVEVLDPRDMLLPDVGDVLLRDAESGDVRELRVTETVRRDFAAAAVDHQRRVLTALRGSGASALQLRTDRDWVADIARFVARRRRGLAAGIG